MTKWTVEMQEHLLEIAQRHEEEFSREAVHTETSLAIQAVQREFNHPDIGAKAILYQLARCGFLIAKARNAWKLGEFHAKPDDYSLQNFRVSAQYPDLNGLEREYFENAQGQLRELLRAPETCSQSIDEWSQKIADELNTTARHALKLLFDANLIQLNHLKEYEWVSQSDSVPSESMMDFVAAQRPDQILKDRVNNSRASISSLFDTRQHPQPSLILCNYGTGLGKSYGVIDQYLREVAESAGGHHRNLFFITPQKAQIDFDPELLARARKQQVEIVAFLSRDDTTDLDFKDWLAGGDGSRKTNLEHYKGWYKRAKAIRNRDPSLFKVIAQVSDEIDMIRRLQSKLKKAMQEGELTTFVDSVRDQITDSRYRLERALQEAARTALCHRDKAVELVELFSDSEQEELRLRGDIIRRLVPFAVAMVKPTLLVATTKKFDQTALLPYLKATGDEPDAKAWTLLSRPFDCIIGGKQKLKSNNADAYADEDLAGKMRYLRSEVFKGDEQNAFHTRKIPFTVVIDEEHEAYEVLQESVNTRLVDKGVTLPHVLSSVCRLYRQVQFKSPEPDEVPLFKDKAEFIQNIETALMNRCEVSGLDVLKRVLDLFSNNVDYAYISGQHSEQIIGLVRSVFSFNAKRYFHEDDLKNVRLRSRQDGAGVELYHTTDADDLTISLYEAYQVLLACLYAAIHVKTSGNLVKLLGQSGDSHNQPLVQFIRRANKHKPAIENLFIHSGEQSLLDFFFVYFRPKTIFSIIPVESLDYADPSIENKVFVSFSVEIMLEQPEVKLLRMLHNTCNTAICLSATTGFKGNITGQFNRAFLQEYCEGEPDNLAIAIRYPSADLLQNIEQLREDRKQMRHVSFHIFDVQSTQLPATGRQPDDEYQRVFDHYYCTLKQQLYNSFLSSYPELEFRRGIDAILRAAYDGKHTLSLSLSHRLLNALKSYIRSIRSGDVFKPRNLELVDDQDFAFEIRPFDNGITLRVVLFSSETSKQADPREYTRVDNSSTKLMFVASYRSAGTGLNYFVCQQFLDNIGRVASMDVDFERLVLVNQPYYTRVMGNGDEGYGNRLNTLANINRLMKYRAAQTDLTLLRDFDANLATGSDYEFLSQEHRIEQLKVFMQAIGRVERKDSLIDTEIFISSEAFDIAMLSLTIARRQPENRTLFGSLSLLNDEFARRCFAAGQRCCFQQEEDRRAFCERMRTQNNQLKYFLGRDGGVITTILEAARQGVTEAIEFNEAFRSIESFTNPAAYLQRLKACAQVAENPRYQALIDQLYIPQDKELVSIKLCEPEDPDDILTDLKEGRSLYDPVRRAGAGRTFSDDTPLGPMAQKLFKKVRQVEEKAFQQYIPHPGFIPHLKGNLGEYLLRSLLDMLDHLQVMTPDQVRSNIGSRCYELFDLYVTDSEGRLFCLDAKNWSSSLDNKHDQSRSTLETAVSKLNTIISLAQGRFPEIYSLYINTRYEDNSLYHKQDTHPHQSIHYLNLFVRESGYKGVVRNLPNRTDKVSREKHEIRVNSTLLKLLGAPYDHGERYE